MLTPGEAAGESLGFMANAIVEPAANGWFFAIPSSNAWSPATTSGYPIPRT
jgi:hypothetical protein